MGYRDSYYSHVHFKSHKQVLYLDWQKDVFPTPDQLHNNANNVYRNSNNFQKKINGRVVRSNVDHAANLVNVDEDCINGNGLVNLSTVNQYWDYYHDEDDFALFQMCSVGPEGSILFHKEDLSKPVAAAHSEKLGSLDLPKIAHTQKTQYYKGLKPGIIGTTCDGRMEDRNDMNMAGMAENMEEREIMGKLHGSHQTNNNNNNNNNNIGDLNAMLMNETHIQDQILRSQLREFYQDYENDELNAANYKIYNLPKEKVKTHNLWPEYGLERFLVKLLPMQDLKESTNNHARKRVGNHANEHNVDDPQDMVMMNLLNDESMLTSHETNIFSDSKCNRNDEELLKSLQATINKATIAKTDRTSALNILNISNNYRNTDPFEAVFYDGNI